MITSQRFGNVKLTLWILNTAVGRLGKRFSSGSLFSRSYHHWLIFHLLPYGWSDWKKWSEHQTKRKTRCAWLHSELNGTSDSTEARPVTLVVTFMPRWLSPLMETGGDGKKKKKKSKSQTGITKQLATALTRINQHSCGRTYF